jgi:nucleoside-diphosphate-sugar epimerase
MFIKYLQRKLPLVPTKLAYSWAHVDDIAQGHILGMEKGKVGESYIIAGHTHTLIEALQMAEKITSVPPSRIHVSPAMVKAMADMMSVVEKIVPVPYDYTSEYLRVSAGVTYIGSNAKARREWGYDPRPLEEGLAETLQHEMKGLGMKSVSEKS